MPAPTIAAQNTASSAPPVDARDAEVAASGVLPPLQLGHLHDVGDGDARACHVAEHGEGGGR